MPPRFSGAVFIAVSSCKQKPGLECRSTDITIVQGLVGACSHPAGIVGEGMGNRRAVLVMYLAVGLVFNCCCHARLYGNNTMHLCYSSVVA